MTCQIIYVNSMTPTSARETISSIISLKWERLNISDMSTLMVISKETAREFAESLHIALVLHPKDVQLKAMAFGELATDNLSYANWKRTGDHWEFLDQFLLGKKSNARTEAACVQYKQFVKNLSPQVRAMSIFSREQELPHIFTKILSAPAWHEQLPGHLKAFRYYLEQHIELDSEDGGHAELVKAHPITEEVATFYKARLNLYVECLPHIQ